MRLFRTGFPLSTRHSSAYFTVTLSNVAVHSAPLLCAVTAKPMYTVPGKFGMVCACSKFQVRPSFDVYPVRLLPWRTSRTHVGALRLLLVLLPLLPFTK